MSWFAYALLAAVLWGGSYVMYGQLLKTISSASCMLYTASGTLFVYLAFARADGTLGHDWQIVKKGGMEAKLLLAIIGVNALANLVLLVSMKAKNATAAGLVEIAYPLFTALFAWIFFRQSELSWGTAFGGLLIMAGVTCIYYFERTA